MPHRDLERLIGGLEPSPEQPPSLPLWGAFLAERDQMLRMFRAAPVGFMLLERTGHASYVNDALEGVLGLEAARVCAVPFESFIDPILVDGWRRQWERLWSGAAESVRTCHRLRHGGGEIAITEMSLTALKGPDGKVTSVIAVLEDVTERNKLELELRQSQKLESVGRLAAGIAHEINTPIQFVGDNAHFLASAFTDLLALIHVYRRTCDGAAVDALGADQVAALRDAERQADLDYLSASIPTSIASMTDGVKRVARIVHAMRSFAHPDQGQQTRADLNAALRSTLTIATNEVKYVADVVLELGELAPVPCFLGEMNQVFLNLLTNAAHAIGDVVGSSGDKGTITVRTYPEPGWAVISIGDTGAGIPSTVRSRIFDPFFTTKGLGKGTGQGLAICHSVVAEMHGGTITFETEIGRGTTFFVRLPTGE